MTKILTLLRARGERQRAKLLGQKFFDGSIAEIYFLTEVDIRQAWSIFEQYHDKSWSFTDCSSKVVIDVMNIAQALLSIIILINSGQYVLYPKSRNSVYNKLEAKRSAFISAIVSHILLKTTVKKY